MATFDSRRSVKPEDQTVFDETSTSTKIFFTTSTFVTMITTTNFETGFATMGRIL
jgi:hypothetical protein